MVMKATAATSAAAGAGTTRATRIVIAGCGPGAPDLMAPAVNAAARTADVLVGAKRLLELFPAVPAQRIVVGRDIALVLTQMAALPAAHKVVVLVSGDPGFHSFGRSVLARFGRHACEVIPGISSVQVAFARIGVTWEDVHLVSAHDAIPAMSPATLAGHAKLAVLAGNPVSAPWLDDAVRTLHPTHAVFACSDLTLPAERVEELVAGQVAAAALPSRTVLLFIRRSLLA